MKRRQNAASQEGHRTAFLAKLTNVEKR